MGDSRNVEGLSESQTSTPKSKKGVSLLGAAKSLIMTIGLITAADKGMDIKRNPETVGEGAARIVRNAGAMGTEGLKNIVSIKELNEQRIPAKGATLEQSRGVRIEKGDSVEHAIDLFYSGATEEERKQLSIQIGVTKHYMVKNHLLTKESFERAIADETMVSELAAKNHTSGEVVTALGLGESGWNPDRKSDSDAWGVFQLTEDWAKDHDIPITRDENDGRLDTRLAAEKVAEQLRADFIYFNGEGTDNNNWSLPILAHLNGREGTKVLVNSWSAEHANSYSSFPALVAELNPSAIRLFSGKYTQEEYSNEDYSGAPFYIPRIAASLDLLEEYKIDGDAIFTKYGN